MWSKFLNYSLNFQKKPLKKVFLYGKNTVKKGKQKNIDDLLLYMSATLTFSFTLIEDIQYHLLFWNIWDWLNSIWMGTSFWKLRAEAGLTYFTAQWSLVY